MSSIRLNEIIVVPATRTIRGVTTEVVLTVDDGMPAACALNFDHVSLAQRSRIGPSCAIYQKRDGLKCGMRCSSRAVSEDQAIEAAKQALLKNDRSELPRARSLGVPRVIEMRRPQFDSSATFRSCVSGRWFARAYESVETP